MRTLASARRGQVIGKLRDWKGAVPASIAFRVCSALLLWAFAPTLSLVATEQDAQDYVIGPRDILRIEVFNQPDLSGHYTVEIDGSLSFPLVGRLVAAQQTVRSFEEQLLESLSPGYFKNPRVSVAVAEYKSRQVFIIGAVRQPGAYPLAGSMSVIELLALAGGRTQFGSGEALALRGGPEATGPVLPTESDGASKLRLDLEALEDGDLSQNVSLRHGDTIFVLQTEVVYVFGEVRNPGQYPIRSGMTVLQALALAGGATEFAALNRIRIVRSVDGEQKERHVQLGVEVGPNDIVRVPVRYF